MVMLAEACQETLPALAELAAGVTRPEGAEADGWERRRWSLMEGVGARRLHLVRPRPWKVFACSPTVRLRLCGAASGCAEERTRTWSLRECIDVHGALGPFHMRVAET